MLHATTHGTFLGPKLGQIKRRAIVVDARYIDPSENDSVEEAEGTESCLVDSTRNQELKSPVGPSNA